MTKYHRTATVLAVASLLFAAAPSFVPFARAQQIDPTPVPIITEVPIPGTPLTEDGSGKLVDLAQYIGIIYNFLISIVGILAAVMFVIGGFQYVASGGDSGRVGAAKKRIMGALIGLLLALGSYTILNTINPAVLKLKVPGLAAVTTLSVGNNFCPNNGVFEGDYACGQTYPFNGGCMGIACAQGHCYPNIPTVADGYNSTEPIKFNCIVKAECGDTCAQNPTQLLCESTGCWEKSTDSVSCYWDGSGCKAGRDVHADDDEADDCDNGYECASRVCNKYLGNSCMPLGGSAVGVGCDRNVECGCTDLDKAGTPACPKLCNTASGFNKCISPFSKASGVDCTYDEECSSRKCDGGIVRTNVVVGGAGTYAGVAVACGAALALAPFTIGASGLVCVGAGVVAGVVAVFAADGDCS